MYKQDLALNNQQWLICHKSQPNYYKHNIIADLKPFSNPNSYYN